jgi:hypothetical protein
MCHLPYAVLRPVHGANGGTRERLGAILGLATLFGVETH